MTLAGSRGRRLAVRDTSRSRFSMPALGLANLIVVALVLRAWGAEGVKDVAAFLFKTFFDLEVKGLENLPKPGEKAIIAPNHVSLLDAPLMHSLAALARRICRRHRHGQHVVGEAVPEACEVLRHRSDASARHAPSDPGGEGRLVARHLSGRPPHRHRRPDEGLRRHRDDRRQGRCAGHSGAHRWARALALRLPEQSSDEESLVPEDDGNDPAAGQAQGRSELAR